MLHYETNLTARPAFISSFAGELDRPGGLKQAFNGEWYVAEQKASGRILRYSSTGRTQRAVVAQSGIDFSGNPEALTTGGDGHIYMTTAFGPGANRLYRIHAVTGEVTRIAAGTQFDEPRGIAYSPFNDSLYVAERAGHSLKRLDMSGTLLETLYSGPKELEGLIWDEDHSRLVYSKNHYAAGDVDLQAIHFDGPQLPGPYSTPDDVGRVIGIVCVGPHRPAGVVACRGCSRAGRRRRGLSMRQHHNTTTYTQKVRVASHACAFAYFGGVLRAIVPDNLKSGVTNACRYEPELQRSYEHMTQHYRPAEGSLLRARACILR